MNSINTINEQSTHALDWLHPSPFISSWKIDTSHLDHYQHTNNLAYLARLERLAWEHSAQLGLTFAEYEQLDRAMVITKHELNYHFPTHLGDDLACATWIVNCDNKFRLNRDFQYINPHSGRTVFSATTHFVCVSLKTGMPKRMPEAFKHVYGQAALSTNLK